MLHLKSLEIIDFHDQILLMGDEDYKSNTVIDYVNPAIDAWVADHPIMFYDNGEIRTLDASSFFSLLANKMDLLKIAIEPDDDSETAEFLAFLCVQLLEEDVQDGFLRFLQKDIEKNNQKSKGGIYQVSIYEESSEPPILCGIAIQKGESIQYDFDASDEEIYPFLEDLLGEDHIYDINQYTPKVFQKLYKEFGDLEDFD